MNIQNKTAVITGGTKGIGYAVAESLASSGANAFICGRHENEVIEAIKRLESKGKVAGMVCDVRNEWQVKQLIDGCAREFGGIDILVNNAGMGVFGKTVEQTSSDEFRQVLETNLFGIYYACHFAIPLIRQRGGGYIINISSLAGQYPKAKLAAYNASKYAVNGFSEALMQEVRHDNIKVSYICPGSVNTYFGDDTPSDDKAWQIQPEDIGEIVKDLLNMNPNVLPSRIEIRPTRPPKP